MICGSLGVFFRLFLCMDGETSVRDIWSMFLEFLEVLKNELTHYFDLVFLFWGSWYCCYILLFFLEEGVEILREEGRLCDFVLSAFFLHYSELLCRCTVFWAFDWNKVFIGTSFGVTDFIVCFKVIDVIQIVFWIMPYLASSLSNRCFIGFELCFYYWYIRLWLISFRVFSSS